MSKMTIGTNFAGVASWSPQVPFIDLFKTSRYWITHDEQRPNTAWDTQEQHILDLDSEGWVKSLGEQGQYTSIGTVVGDNAGIPLGQYVVTYQGEGNIKYGRAATLVSSTPGRDIIYVKDRRGIHIKITEINPKNYLRNIEVRPLALESRSDETFNPRFLRQIQPYGAIRFMGWQKTNGSQERDWENRPQPQQTTYAGSKNKDTSVPLEIMVELANKLQLNPWFCMPHMANNEYVENFARYVKANLNPDLKIYVELSNEVWNPGFSQNRYAVEQSRRIDGSNNYVSWFGTRTTQITQIWDEVYGEDKEKVIGVMGARLNDVSTARKLLTYIRQSNGNSSFKELGIDVIGITGYFGFNLQERRELATLIATGQPQKQILNELFDEILEGGVLPSGHKGGNLQRTFGYWDAYNLLAQQQGLNLVAYEGGQHLTDFTLSGGDTINPKLTNLFVAANRDRRMGIVYDRLLQGIASRGADLFMHFVDISNHGQYGSWGALESVLQATSPKHQALMNFIEANNKA